jgi:hypothetical protein
MLRALAKPLGLRVPGLGPVGTAVQQAFCAVADVEIKK